VDLFNRTDCCATRLNNFYVFVSPTDMTGQTLAQILANPAVSRQYVAAAGYVHENITQLLSVDFNGATGRYVRVQLAGSNALHLAEVKVMGWAPGAR
jgi:alpha-L-fucosidase 2